jgi:hypothetical protein
MKRLAPCQGRIGRSLRSLGFDRNPMRRSTDRIQAIVRAGLVAAFLAGAPIAATHVSHGIYLSGLRAGHAQAAGWHRVPALVLRAKPIATAWQRSPHGLVLFSLRWTAPDGSARTGETMGVEGPVAGRVMTVWTDEKGQLAHPPLSLTAVANRARYAAIAIPVALALLLAAMGGVVSLVLDKRRLACWEADWSAVEPQWTGRR